MPDKPYKFTTKKKDEYLEHLQKGGRRGAAAEAVGVTRQTVRLHTLQDPEFAVAVQQAELDANEMVEDALFKAAIGGNVTACLAWSYSRAPDRWQDKRNRQPTFDSNVKIGVTFDENFYGNADQLRAIRAAEANAKPGEPVNVTRSRKRPEGREDLVSPWGN